MKAKRKTGHGLEKFSGRRFTEREARRLAQELYWHGLESGYWGRPRREGAWEKMAMLGGTWRVNGK